MLLHGCLVWPYSVFWVWGSVITASAFPISSTKPFRFSFIPQCFGFPAWKLCIRQPCFKQQQGSGFSDKALIQGSQRMRCRDYQVNRAEHLQLSEVETKNREGNFFSANRTVFALVSEILQRVHVFFRPNIYSLNVIQSWVHKHFLYCEGPLIWL